MIDSNAISERRPTRERLIEWLVIFAIFAIFAASPPPDVNEAHYLAKARHFWDPDWLRGDLFLESGYAHWLFYVTFGWLTVVVDLPTSAWIGRIVGWAMLAWGWENLAEAIGLRRFGKIFASVCLLALIQIANLSGEWLVGGIEAKVPAYALVFFALGNIVRGGWVWVWPVLGLATGFHLLVGGWSFLACLLIRVSSERGVRIAGKELGSLVAGALIAATLGVLTSIFSEIDVDAPVRIAAAAIYVRGRVNHHLYFWDFARGGIVSFGLLVFVWRELSRHGRVAKLSQVNAFAAASLILVAGGIGLSTLANFDVSRNWANYFLRFYWFRLADIAVPCAVALGLAMRWNRMARMTSANEDTGRSDILRVGLIRKGAMPITLAVATGVCAWTVVDRWIDGRPGADRQSLPTYADSSVRTWETYRNWVRVCVWIKDNTPRDAAFLTPRQQQTFKWYAARLDYVNWKDIPQDPIAIYEWCGRMDEVFGPSWDEFQWSAYEQNLWRSWRSYSGAQARYVVVEQETWQQLQASGDSSPLELVYPSDPARRTTYVVLKVSEVPDANAPDNAGN